MKLICERAFASCLSLSEISVPFNPPKLSTTSFGDCTNLEIVKYNGLKSDWRVKSQGTGWDNISVICPRVVKCLDGDITICDIKGV